MFSDYAHLKLMISDQVWEEASWSTKFSAWKGNKNLAKSWALLVAKWENISQCLLKTINTSLVGVSQYILSQSTLLLRSQYVSPNI